MEVLMCALPLLWLASVAWSRHCESSRLQLLRISRRNGCTLELRRRALLQAASPGEFPQPREERVVMWRLAGVPVHVQRSVVGLPLQTDARIDSLTADEYDGRFSPWFRLDPDSKAP